MDSLLPDLLALAVPVWVTRLHRDGGPTEETYERCREWTEKLCGPGGEDLLFKSKKPGETARRFNDLAYCLAVMAFCPGGVTLLGKHWEVKEEKHDTFTNSLPPDAGAGS